MSVQDDKTARPEKEAQAARQKGAEMEYDTQDEQAFESEDSPAQEPPSKQKSEDSLS
jgi:hypothetical protein